MGVERRFALVEKYKNQYVWWAGARKAACKMPENLTKCPSTRCLPVSARRVAKLIACKSTFMGVIGIKFKNNQFHLRQTLIRFFFLL